MIHRYAILYIIELMIYPAATVMAVFVTDIRFEQLGSVLVVMSVIGFITTMGIVISEHRQKNHGHMEWGWKRLVGIAVVPVFLVILVTLGNNSDTFMSEIAGIAFFVLFGGAFTSAYLGLYWIIASAYRNKGR